MISDFDVNRNVIDEFKCLSNEEIKFEVAKRTLPFAVCFQHWTGDFNIATGIRNANSFGAREIFYLGKKKIDRRGCQGSYLYSPVQYLEEFENLAELKSKYIFIGVENNTPKTTSLYKFEPPDNSLFIFGEENKGITDSTLALCDYLVEIPSRGSIRSLNVGTTSGIVMNHFAQKYLERNQ